MLSLRRQRLEEELSGERSFVMSSRSIPLNPERLSLSRCTFTFASEKPLEGQHRLLSVPSN